MSFCFKDLNPVRSSFNTGEESIFLLVPDAASLQQQYKQALQQDPSTPFPYWAKIWPAARALATFIAQNPAFVTNQNVVEMGCGLGLPSFTAARWAASVYATDVAPETQLFLQHTVQQQQWTHVSFGLLDWHTTIEYPTAGVLLLSDVNYDPHQFPAVRKLITHYINTGSTVILSSPHRLMAKPFIEELLPLCMHQENFTIETVEISIFVLKKQ